MVDHTLAAECLPCPVETSVFCQPACQPLLLLSVLLFKPMSRRFLFGFSFRSFVVSGHVFQLLDPLEVKFYMWASVFCVNIWFPQPRLLKRLSSPPKVFLAALSEMSQPQMPGWLLSSLICMPFSYMLHTVALTYAQMRKCGVSVCSFCSRFWALHGSESFSLQQRIPLGFGEDFTDSAGYFA